MFLVILIAFLLIYYFYPLFQLNLLIYLLIQKSSTLTQSINYKIITFKNTAKKNNFVIIYFFLRCVPLPSKLKMLNPKNDFFCENDPDICRKVYGFSFVKFSFRF